MEGVVRISDLMEHLKANDLVIVKRGELLDSARITIELMQAEFLKRKYLSCSEIIKAKLLPLKSDEGIRHWIKRGVIKEDEIFYTSTNRLRILTSAVKRLRNEN